MAVFPLLSSNNFSFMGCMLFPPVTPTGGRRARARSSSRPRHCASPPSTMHHQANGANRLYSYPSRLEPVRSVLSDRTHKRLSPGQDCGEPERVAWPTDANSAACASLNTASCNVTCDYIFAASIYTDTPSLSLKRENNEPRRRHKMQCDACSDTLTFAAPLTTRETSTQAPRPAAGLTR